MHGRAVSTLVLASLSAECGMSLVHMAEQPGSAGGHGVPDGFGFVLQNPVPELGVCLVGVMQGIRPASGFQHSLDHRVLSQRS